MEVIPIPLTNQHQPLPSFRTRTFFIVRALLDEDALRNALSRLIRDHWRKLGARLFANPKTGFLEYHLPKTFSDDAALFQWSSTVEDAPVDSILPSPEATSRDRIALLPSIKVVEDALGPAGWPLELAGNPQETPFLHVHVSKFLDATIVGINIPHVVGDQLGLANLVKAWLGLMRGEDPPPMIGFDDDPLPDEPYRKADNTAAARKGRIRVKRRGENALVLSGFVPDLVKYSKETRHIVFFPRALISGLRQKYADELRQQHDDSGTISEGDILTAILTKFSQICRKRSKMMCLTQTVNVRGRVPRLSGSSGHGFIHNGLTYATSYFRMDRSTPITEIAYRNRQAVIRGSEPEEIKSVLAIMREMARRKQSMHVCEPFATSFSVISWLAAWKDIDFSSAVNTTGMDVGPDGVNKKPEMFVLGCSGSHDDIRRFYCTIMDRTSDGYWVDFSCSDKALQVIQDYLAEDPTLSKF